MFSLAKPEEIQNSGGLTRKRLSGAHAEACVRVTCHQPGQLYEGRER